MVNELTEKPVKVRAHKVDDLSAEYGQPAWKYSDGSIRGEAGKLIEKMGGGLEITPANARQLNRRATEIKRAVIMAAANREVQDETLIRDFGEYAYIAEGAITMQKIATTPEAGKAAIMAYESLINNSGMGEKQQEQQQARTDDPVAHALLALVRHITKGQANREVIDGHVQEPD
jgi:hypothetical protein